jgi:hypothetical protein
MTFELEARVPPSIRHHSYRPYGALCAVLTLMGIPAEGRAQRTPSTTRHAAITLAEWGGPLVMALGDTLALRANVYECHGDFCMLETPKGPAQFRSHAAALQVTASGTVRATRTGLYAVSATIGEYTARDSVRVLPPVKDLVWSVHADTVFVGDTLHIGIVARDSSGATVRRLGVVQIGGGTGTAGEMLRWDQDGRSTLYVNRSGIIEVVGVLAHRVDTLRLPAIVRPPRTHRPDRSPPAIRRSIPPRSGVGKGAHGQHKRLG